MEHFIFTNARIVLPDTILDDHYLSVKNGVIESIGKGTPDREQLNSCTTVDCGGQYLSPDLSISTVMAEAGPTLWTGT